MNTPLPHDDLFSDPTVPAAHAAPRDRPVRQSKSLRQWLSQWPLVAAALMLVLGIVAHALQAGTVSKPGNKQHDGFFAPANDLAAALENARMTERQGVAVLFEMEGCGECAKLRATTFKDNGLRQAFERNFVTVSLLADYPLPVRDFDGQDTLQTEFAQSQHIFALPTLVFYDLDGIPVARQIGSAGDVPDWIRLAHYVIAKGYEELPFTHWRPDQ
ncbi:MAG: thioredoxin fold domain-containing protein [Rhodocyclaceae bacterium]